MKIREATLLLGCILLAMVQVPRRDPAGTACSMLAAALPQRVATRLSVQYFKDNYHWAISTVQLSRCSVRPASPAEVATIFHVINQTRTPWAIKGGGHGYNQGYSSTRGVQITLAKFNTLTYDANTSTAHIGAGMIWDDVYAALIPHGVNVVGGRVRGVGVSGFTLGGGYGWHTPQYGLAIDRVVSFDLVTPTGAILTVTEQSHPDLFFGLRGGGNNFGIVTGFRVKTFGQGQVYAGTLGFKGDLSAVTDAIIDFDANNQDPKAVILASYTSLAMMLENYVLLFYDGPTPPPGTFDKFLKIPAYRNSIKTQSYSSFFQDLPTIIKPLRMAAHTVPIIQYTRPIVDQIITETRNLGRRMLMPGPTTLTSLSIESFTRNIYNHSAGGAYPHNAEHPWTPFTLVVHWLLPMDDDAFRAAVLCSAEAIHRVAIAEGQSSADAVLYSNYAMRETPAELLYGENLPRLQALQELYDPQNLRGLTGGWALNGREPTASKARYDPRVPVSRLMGWQC